MYVYKAYVTGIGEGEQLYMTVMITECDAQLKPIHLIVP